MGMQWLTQNKLEANHNTPKNQRNQEKQTPKQAEQETRKNSPKYTRPDNTVSTKRTDRTNPKKGAETALKTYRPDNPRKGDRTIRSIGFGQT